jgi:hypothetical protein
MNLPNSPTNRDRDGTTLSGALHKTNIGTSGDRVRTHNVLQMERVIGDGVASHSSFCAKHLSGTISAANRHERC